MYKISKNGKRVQYSEPMFNILTSYFNTIKGDDSNRSQRTVVEDRDREVEQLTDNERENNEEREDKETLATILEDTNENDQENNNTDEENQTNVPDTSVELMNISVLQNNLLQAENKHLHEAYNALAYEGNQPF